MSRIEEQYHCLGYFGFGSGIDLGRRYRSGDLPAGENESSTADLYCSRCPLAASCWRQHSDRVRAVFPALMDEFDRMAATMRGAELVKAWFERFQTADPLVSVMAGNLEDAGLVESGGRPKDRGPGTLPYPFVPEARA